MFDFIVRGRVVTPDAILEDGWLAIADGTIAALGQADAPIARMIHDYGTALIMPGAIDGQTHAGSQVGFDGIANTTWAAAMGGVTTIVDMPYDHPLPVTDGAVLSEKIAAVERLAYCDVALYGTVPASPLAASIAELIDGGVCAFKISSFEAHPDRFPRIDNAATLFLLRSLEGTGLPLGLHNEDQDIVRAMTNAFEAEGRTGPLDHSPSRPPVAELAATATFLQLAASTEAHAHIVHISVAEGFDLVAGYRGRGGNATAEMCLHYLVFDGATDMERLGGLLKVNPPIRPDEREALWQCLEDGHVSFVSSDHSAWALDRKTSKSIFDVAAGMPGLEVLMPGFYTALAQRKGPEEAAMMTADYLAARPAKFFGLSTKGRLAPGYDADITVLDANTIPYDSRRNDRGPGWSAYDGMVFERAPVATYVRGVKMWDGATVCGPAGHGRYVRRS